ncbi:hypothetical protein [Sandaracinus amylolyticus]|uniref:hypothetical protein n=1 Tax=Sandaracinus amylolyticus TaxID=927083 RepID=UPI001F41666E|nr:hypothetical protein [Sandaracinus amylolyticus]
MRARALLLAMLLAGCSGIVLDGAAGPTGSGPNDPPDDPSDPVEPTTPDDPFALDRETPRLLPFETRLARVAAVAGIETSDPLLAPMRDQAVALGGYDHSRGILPDSSWNATRIAGWVRAVRPVCQSDAMRTRYPAVPGADLDALIQAAWGRAATAEDRTEIESAVAGLPEDAARESACLAVLSAGEAVLQ